MITFLKNLFSPNKYKGHPEAVIISCFFNPQNSPYRLKAFKRFYDDIKHLNHRIIECVIGDAKPQLEGEHIAVVHTENLLWHKEALLNKIVKGLSKDFKYIFWVDADVIFSNKNWIVESVEQLHSCNILQPFEYCFHLDKDELVPSPQSTRQKWDIDAQLKFSINAMPPNWKMTRDIPNAERRVWRSFSSNWVCDRKSAKSENYNTHGHVGFAWGARREILEAVPLYDKALIGGADHIIAHASAGQIPFCCIDKSFTDNLEEVYAWSRKFFAVVKGKIGYVKGDLYHIWHGDIDKRQYLKRIQDFTAKTKNISEKDKNGLYVTNKKDDEYMKSYFKHREVPNVTQSTDDGFLQSMAIGYMTNSTLVGSVLGGNPLGAMVGDSLNTSENNVLDSSNNNQMSQSDISNAIASDPLNTPIDSVTTDNTPFS